MSRSVAGVFDVERLENLETPLTGTRQRTTNGHTYLRISGNGNGVRAAEVSLYDGRLADRRSSWRQACARSAWVARPAGLFVASRVVFLLATGTAGVVTRSSFSRLLGVWDSGWYLQAASKGYPHAIPVHGHAVKSTTIAFFPLLPASVAAVRGATGLPNLVAGLLVSSIFGLAAAVLLWALIRRLAGVETADRACALWCVFPGSFVLSLVYAEGLMIALVIGCMIALLAHRWWLAGVLAALATASRPNALMVIACCAWAAGAAIYRRRDWGSVVAPVLAPFGFLGYFAFLSHWTGDNAAWFRAEGAWGQNLNPLTTWNEVSFFFRHPFAWPGNTAQVAAIVFVVIAGVLLVRTRPPAILLIWAAGIIAIAAMSPASDGITARFILTAFPLVTALAWYLRGVAFTAVVTASAGALGLLTIVSLTTTALTP